MRIIAPVCFTLLLLSGCAAVQPWEREILAEAAMMPGSTAPLEHGFMGHIYFSKEGARGGEGVAAGGCGCN